MQPQALPAFGEPSLPRMATGCAGDGRPLRAKQASSIMERTPPISRGAHPADAAAMQVGRSRRLLGQWQASSFILVMLLHQFESNFRSDDVIRQIITQ